MFFFSHEGKDYIPNLVTGGTWVDRSPGGHWWPGGQEVWFPGTCHPPASWLLQIFPICLLDVSQLGYMWSDMEFLLVCSHCDPAAGHSWHVTCEILPLKVHPEEHVRSVTGSTVTPMNLT